MALTNEIKFWRSALSTRDSEPIVGIFLESTFSVELIEMAGIVGFDFAVVDLEHGPLRPFDHDRLSHAVTAGQVRGLRVVVRLASCDRHEISRVIDTGVAALIAPHIKSASDARRLVDAAQLPPSGTRSQGLVRSVDFGFAPFGFVQSAVAATPTTDPMLIALIEDAEALDHLDDILNVAGIDMAMLGVGDLRRSLLAIHPRLSAETLREALDAIRDAARRHNTPWLVVVPDESRGVKELQKGAVGVCFVDGPLIGRALSMALNTLRPEHDPAE